MSAEKIGVQHRARKAALYVRQSSAHQVAHNRETRALQYAMRDRLTQLGWSEIEVIDEDLGRSAAGGTLRAGFERMVAEVCLGHVGAPTSAPRVFASCTTTTVRRAGRGQSSRGCHGLAQEPEESTPIAARCSSTFIHRAPHQSRESHRTSTGQHSVNSGGHKAPNRGVQSAAMCPARAVIHRSGRLLELGGCGRGRCPR